MGNLLITYTIVATNNCKTPAILKDIVSETSDHSNVAEGFSLNPGANVTLHNQNALTIEVDGVEYNNWGNTPLDDSNKEEYLTKQMLLAMQAFPTDLKDGTCFTPTKTLMVYTPDCTKFLKIDSTCSTTGSGSDTSYNLTMAISDPSSNPDNPSNPSNPKKKSNNIIIIVVVIVAVVVSLLILYMVLRK